jgi:hypothetical protein
MKVYGGSGRVLKVAGRAVLVTWSLAATPPSEVGFGCVETDPGQRVWRAGAVSQGGVRRGDLAAPAFVILACRSGHTHAVAVPHNISAIVAHRLDGGSNDISAAFCA